MMVMVSEMEGNEMEKGGQRQVYREGSCPDGTSCSLRNTRVCAARS